MREYLTMREVAQLLERPLEGLTWLPRLCLGTSSEEPLVPVEAVKPYERLHEEE